MQKPKSSRKPFVKPALTEEASLEDVTLVSGGGRKSGRHGHGKNKKTGKNHHSNHGQGRRS